MEIIYILQFIDDNAKLNSSNCKFTSDYIFSNCRQDDSQDDCLEMGSAYVVVYSVTDCSSFDTASALHIT